MTSHHAAPPCRTHSLTVTASVRGRNTLAPFTERTAELCDPPQSLCVKSASSSSSRSRSTTAATASTASPGPSRHVRRRLRSQPGRRSCDARATRSSSQHHLTCGRAPYQARGHGLRCTTRHAQARGYHGRQYGYVKPSALPPHTHTATTPSNSIHWNRDVSGTAAPSTVSNPPKS
jgi:hypothetical protein